jgi:hypothetical protein
MQQAPVKAYGILAAAVVAFAAGTLLLKQPVFGLIGFAIILGSTADYWLGTSYRLDETGASSRCGLSVSSIAWADVKRVMKDGHTIKLSPLETASRVDPFRGVLLKMLPELGEEVAGFIRRFTPQDV